MNKVRIRIWSMVLVLAVTAVSVTVLPKQAHAAVRLLDKDTATALLQTAKQNDLSYVRISSDQYDGIDASAAETLAGISLEYDTMSGKTVGSRLYFAKPELLREDTVLNGETTADQAVKTKQKLERFFSNKLYTLSVAKQEHWGQQVQIAMRVDMDTTDNLQAYLYDDVNHTYSAIKNPNFRLDSNGKYVYFTAHQSGIFVLSDGALVKRAVPLPPISSAASQPNANRTSSGSGSSRSSSGSWSSSSGGGYTSPSSSNIAVTHLQVSPNAIRLSRGASTRLTATVLPANATNKSVTWSSSNPSVATVDSSGFVKAVAEGNATITAATNSGGLRAGCAVTVTTASPPPVIVPVTGVTLNPPPATVVEGNTIQLTANVLPANATNKSVTWSSDNPSIATVDNNGLVTALAPGSATITVTTNDGGFMAGCTVTVDPALVDAQTPVIYSQSSDQVVPVNTTRTLAITAYVTDGGTLSYQWYEVTDLINAPDGSLIPGATENTYQILSSIPATFYRYCVITNTNTDPSITGSQTASIRSNTIKITFQ